jgi:DNA-directed RNA polymerase subunit RPC12/RpoP
MAKIIGYCNECGSEIFDIDEEYMITGETTGAFECPHCRQMHLKKDIVIK